MSVEDYINEFSFNGKTSEEKLAKIIIKILKDKSRDYNVDAKKVLTIITDKIRVY